MFKIFIILLMGLTLCIASFAQSRRFCDGKIIMLEANYVGTGMSGLQGKHLIAKICEDRTVQFEDLKQTKSGVEYVLRERKLSNRLYTKVHGFLESQAIRELRLEYPAFTPTLDHSEDLILSLFSNREKRISVSNFKPDIPEISVKYPLTLLKLACFANEARGKTDAVFFFRDGMICDKLD